MNSPKPKGMSLCTSERRPPLGIGFLISVLREHGHNVYFLDNCLNPKSNYRELITSKKIHYVGMHIDTLSFLEGCKILFDIDGMRKNREWVGKIMVGGPHPSIMPETIPSFVDYIVQGEGEEAVLDIVNGTQERIIRKEFIENLDNLSSPAWDYFVGCRMTFRAIIFQKLRFFLLILHGDVLLIVLFVQ